jgi:hypothetical protein
MRLKCFILVVVVSLQHALSQNFTDGGLKFIVTGLTTIKVERTRGAIKAFSILICVTFKRSNKVGLIES